MTATPRPRFDQWLLAQTDREDHVGDIAREFSEDTSVGCAGDSRTPEQLMVTLSGFTLALILQSAPLRRFARNTSTSEGSCQ
jgi:hypothetical protein